MTLESAQLLSGVQHVNGVVIPSYVAKVYKLTHQNHPCAKWARESLGNYRWLCSHALELCAEYERRYKKTHACFDLIFAASKFIPNFGKTEFTTPPLAMPEELRGNDVVESYRKYYRTKIFASWSHSPKPIWFEKNA